MLKFRLITALIMIPLVTASIFYLPPLTFLSVAMLVILMAGWEWSQLAGIDHPIKKLTYLVLLALTLVLAISIPVFFVVFIAITWWVVAILLLALYPKGSAYWGKGSMARGFMGLLVLMPCWIGLIILQGFSPEVLMFCLALIWCVDSAAYFVGKKWGAHKMVPAISPGKSYEGFIAGLIAALLIGILGLWLLEVSPQRSLLFLGLCMFGGGILTVLGDLFESMVKRQSHCKDSGTLLPGHGGIMDRIDSMTTAIPFFALIFPYFFSI